MNWNCDKHIDNLVTTTKNKINEHIKILYIQAISESRLNGREKRGRNNKTLNSKMIDKYLQGRGYSHNRVLGRDVMVKGFNCVSVRNDSVEIWHDVPNSKSVFVSNSLLTGLPATLNYMERI